MSWTAPRTYTAGEIITAAILNTHLRDQLRYLKGSDGIPTVESGLIIDATDGDEYLRLPAHTTSEAASTLTTEANVVYDVTLHKMKYYSSGSVEVVLARDDVDDIPVDAASTVPISSNWAYDFINTLTASGDIPYANGAGSWTRLAKGTAGQYLVMSPSASGPSWTTAVPPTKVVKTADETISNSNVYQNDDELVVAMGASAAWLFDVHVIGQAQTPSSGLKTQFTIPGGANSYGIAYYVQTPGTVLSTFTNTGGLGTVFGTSGAETVAIYHLTVINGASAGNFQLQWAQLGADVGQTKVLAKSSIIGYQLV